MSRLRAVPGDRLHLALMLTLTFSTGIVDAVGFLGLDRVFTGNMTGNVVFLGMALVGADGLPVLGPAIALTGFMLGAALAGRVLRRATGTWSHRTTALFGIVAVTLLVLSMVVWAGEQGIPRSLALATTATLGVVMGIQAAAARFIAVKEVTTVVVTSTITGLASDSVLGSAKPGASGRRLLAIVLIGTGAAAGAALLRWHLGAGIAVAGVITAVVTLIGGLHARARPALS